MTNPVDTLFEKKIRVRMERYALNLSTFLKISNNNIGILASRTKQGKLWKRGQFRKSWKNRFFDLRMNQVRYYSDQSLCDQKGMLLIFPGQTKVITPVFTAQEAAVLPTPYCLVIQNHDRSLLCCADTDDLRRDWLRILRAKCMDDKQRELLVQKYQGALVDKALTFDVMMVREEPFLSFLYGYGKSNEETNKEEKKKKHVSLKLSKQVLAKMLSGSPTNNKSQSDDNNSKLLHQDLSDEESDDEVVLCAN